MEANGHTGLKKWVSSHMQYLQFIYNFTLFFCLLIVFVFLFRKSSETGELHLETASSVE